MVDNAPKFGCPQGGLYAVSRLCCSLLRSNIDVFKDFSRSYTTGFADALENEIDEAEALPGETNRVGRRRAMRVSLVRAKGAAMNKWQKLKGYIERAYTDKAMRKAKLSEAGANIYAKANRNAQWTMVNKLMIAGALFITDNNAELLLNDNMPANFEVAYVKAQTGFAKEAEAFCDAGSTNEIQSNEKRLANNNVYAKIITNIQRWAAHIYRYHEEAVYILPDAEKCGLWRHCGYKDITVSW